MRHTQTLMSATPRKTSKKPAAPVAPRGRQRLPTAGSDEKRERILKAAEALFDRYGYANTTIEQIVQALGVTKPFVYYYFRNKQEIFETLCWAPTEACFTVLDFAADDPRPAHEKAVDGLQRLIAATIAHYPAGFFPIANHRPSAPLISRPRAMWPSSFTSSSAPCSTKAAPADILIFVTPASPPRRPAACPAFSTTGTNPAASWDPPRWWWS